MTDRERALNRQQRLLHQEIMIEAKERQQVPPSRKPYPTYSTRCEAKERQQLPPTLNPSPTYPNSHLPLSS